MHGRARADRHILAGHEALIIEAETDLVVAFTFFIVEVPLFTRLALQGTDLDISMLVEPSDPVGSLMRLSFVGIETPLVVERQEKVVAFVTRTF